MSDLVARKAALYARFTANRAEFEAIGQELTELEQLAAAQREEPPSAIGDEPMAPDEAFTGWGRAAVARAFNASRFDVVEDLAAWESALAKTEATRKAATTLDEIAGRSGVPVPHLLDLMHRFRLNVRFADATAPFLVRDAAKRFAKVPGVLREAVVAVKDWRGLWSVLLAEHLKPAVADLIEGTGQRLPGVGPDPVDRLVLQMAGTRQLIVTRQPETENVRIITTMPVEVQRICDGLDALAALAERLKARAAHLPDGRLLLPRRRGQKSKGAHLLACIRCDLEKPLEGPTGGTLTKNDLAMLAALACPETIGSWLASKGKMTPGDYLHQAEKRERDAVKKHEGDEAARRAQRRRPPRRRAGQKSPKRST